MRRYIWKTTAAAAAGALVLAATAVAGNGNGNGKGNGNGHGQGKAHKSAKANKQGPQTPATTAARCVLNTQLRAANEPTVLSTAKGHAQLKVLQNGQLRYKIQILNKAGENFTAGHIHLTATGGVIQGLFAGPATTAKHIRLSNTITIDPALAAGLCTTPTNYYVNFHPTAAPAGAIRGNFHS